VRRLPALLILLWVALDFANPLVPGAVTFDAATCVDAVRPERDRPLRGAVAALPGAPPPAAVAGPALVPAPSPAPRTPAPPIRRRATAPRSALGAESPSPPGDDA
jgi:hypothetical protein